MSHQSQPKKQNPLFSANVTGGIEDFGSSIVLAAAEKPVFTIGTAPVINDLDNFSEVSLDRDGNSEVGSGPFYSNPLAELDSYANLQNLQDAPTLDLNSNSQQQQQHYDQQVDVNTNPITALGSAASTVFSAFSSIMKGSTSQTRIDESQQNQSIPSIPPHHHQMPSEGVNINPYGLPPPQADVNAPPPTFFSPGDENLFKKSEVETPSNTFRMGSNKKKTYAHIPGLSSSQTQNVPQNFNLNPVMPPMPPQPVTHVDSMANFQPPTPLNPYQNQPQQIFQQEVTQVSPEKPASNKFSLSSLLDKIPVTKNIFGSSSEENHQEQPQHYGYQDFSVTTQSVNAFVPQPPQVNENQPTINFFNQQQQSIDVKQPTIGETPAAPVNFFNPQQFNTTPFAAKVQQPEKVGQIVNPQELPHVALTSSQGSFVGVPQAPIQTFSEAPTQVMPPKIESSAITQPPQAFPAPNDSIPQSFSTPPTHVADPTPISFFNPSEASELFKSRQTDDGKPKNPYSNTRARGVGLYKPRSSLTNETPSPQVMMPPIVPTQQPTPTQEFFNPIPTQARPPSNPPASSFIAPIESVNDPIYDSTIAQKKSDLNVPENENVVEQFQVHPTANNVSNFFGIDAANKVNEQASALNFFQATPEINQPVANFPPPQPLDTVVDSGTSINFFSSEIPIQEQVQAQEQKQLESRPEEFSSPAVSSSTMQTFTPLNDTSLVNDITDKMESLSACSRSTLSLFATSELDSAATLKHTSNLESLIPKYLETQQDKQGHEKVSHEETPPVMRERPVSASPGLNKSYRPVYCHWFYQNLYWHPFSMTDSMAIETAIASGDDVITSNGGRYEVNINERRRSSIYWPSGSNAIRKCSWFFMDTLTEKRNLIPYEENIAEGLEKEYEKALNHSRWNHRIHLPELLPSQEFIIFKDATTIEHHKIGQILMVKRGLDEFDIVDGEEGTADHLILCISSFGDKIDDNADEIRSKGLELLQQYYSEALDCGQISRIEVLPIALNSIDVLKIFELNETLEGASRRNSTKDLSRHVMRTMLYSNENFYQKIMNHLAFSINEIVSKFKQRNSNFDGEISLMSASYEALFVFDLLLANQCSDVPNFWKLNFDVSKFFACGMPISLLTIRNGENLKHGFELKKCKKFFNVLHPMDPIGQRIEPLIIPEYSSLPPENIENLSSSLNERIDFILAEEILESFSSSVYFTSESLMRSLINEIYGANKMDSGSL